MGLGAWRQGSCGESPDHGRCRVRRAGDGASRGRGRSPRPDRLARRLAQRLDVRWPRRRGRHRRRPGAGGHRSRAGGHGRPRPGGGKVPVRPQGRSGDGQQRSAGPHDPRSRGAREDPQDRRRQLARRVRARPLADHRGHAARVHDGSWLVRAVPRSKVESVLGGVDSRRPACRASPCIRERSSGRGHGHGPSSGYVTNLLAGGISIDSRAPWVDVRDVAQAIVLAFDKAPGSRYLLTSGVVRHRDLAPIIDGLTGQRPTGGSSGPRRPGASPS